MKRETGQRLTVKGREYIVDARIPVGNLTRERTGQVALILLKGKRGGLLFGTEFIDGTMSRPKPYRR